MTETSSPESYCWPRLKETPKVWPASFNFSRGQLAGELAQSQLASFVAELPTDIAHTNSLRTTYWHHTHQHLANNLLTSHTPTPCRTTYWHHTHQHLAERPSSVTYTNTVQNDLLTSHTPTACRTTYWHHTHQHLAERPSDIPHTNTLQNNLLTSHTPTPCRTTYFRHTHQHCGERLTDIKHTNMHCAKRPADITHVNTLAIPNIVKQCFKIHILSNTYQTIKSKLWVLVDIN